MNISAPALNLQINPSLQPLAAPNRGVGAVQGEKGFSDLLGDLVNKVDGLQKNADAAVEGVVTGQVTDIHQVSVKVQEAGIAFDLMVGVRNRLMDAYSELLKIQA